MKVEENMIQVDVDAETKTNGANSCSNDLTYSTSWSIILPNGCWQVMRPKNAYVPKRILANEEEGVVIVEWDTGNPIKITCDAEDTFSVDVAFGLALTYRLFGGKNQFKSKWWDIILRRVTWLGNMDSNQKREEKRIRLLKEKALGKKAKRLAREKQERIDQLEKELEELKN